MYAVYALLDDKGVRYVGRSVDLRHRLYCHWKYRNKRDFPVYRWLRKQPSLRWTILEFCFDVKALDASERQWIALFKPTGLLLNLTEGGEGCLGYRHSAQNREKISKAQQGRKISEHVRQALYAGRDRYWANFENKQKHRIHFEKMHSDTKKPVLCSNGITYSCVSEASRVLGIAKALIRKVAQAEYFEAKGYRFWYTNPEEAAKYQEAHNKILQKMGKPVRCSNGKTYDNIRQAARDLKLRATEIRLSFIGKRKKIKGYTFSYVTDTTQGDSI